MFFFFKKRTIMFGELEGNIKIIEVTIYPQPFRNGEGTPRKFGTGFGVLVVASSYSLRTSTNFS